MSDQESLFAAIFEEAAIGMALVDRSGRALKSNRALQEWLGYSAAELRAMSFDDYTLAQDIANDRNLFEELVQGTRSRYQVEKRYIRKNGTVVWGQLTVSLVHPSPNDPALVLRMIEDITERKRAEEALHESKARWRSLIKGLPDHILGLDRDLNIQVANYASPGLTVEELIGTPPYSYVAQEQQVEIKAILEHVLETGAPAAYETEYYPPDGGKITYESRVSQWIVCDEVIGLTLSARDITAHKLVEKSLRDSEERLRLILNQLPVMLWTTDTNLIATSSRGAGLAQLGLEPDQIAGVSLEEFVGTNDPTHPAIVGHHAALRGTSSHYLDTVAGRKYDVFIEPLRSGDGIILGILGVSFDITDRLRAEEALHESEECYRLLLDNSLDAILLTAPDGRILTANPAACRMFGRTEEEIRQVGRAGIVDESDPRLAAALEERARTGRFRGELTFLHKDGISFPAEVSSTVFLAPNGERRTSMIIHDITERKRAEQVLRSLSSRLAETEANERRRLRRELHDRVGQNLAALGVHLANLQVHLSAERPDQVQHHLDLACELVAQTTAIIHDIMADLSPPVLEDYGLLAALRWSAKEFAERANIAVTVQGEEPAPRLDSHREIEFFRIAQEALTNVMKHARATHVTVTLETRGKIVRLVIADDGIGFSPVQPDKPTNHPSWGLLTMTERAETIGGQCHIESQPGQGTRVIVAVPR